MANHKPTPWKIGIYVDPKDGSRHVAIWSGQVKEGERGRPVCLISPVENLDDEDTANVEFIVRACNAYDGLTEAIGVSVQALQASVQAEEAIRSDSQPNAFEIVRVARELRTKALLLAKTVVPNA